MLLPGGWYYNGCRYREFQLASGRGELDFSLHDRAADAVNHPSWVTESLLLILKNLGGESPTLDQVRSLCLADRQALAIAWRLQHDSANEWVSRNCSECEHPFDACIPFDQLPFSEAGPLFPFAEVTLQGNTYRIRVPDGSDLEAIAAIDNEQEARQRLARRLFNDSDANKIRWNEKAIEHIENAVEQQVPELATSISTQCPECGAENRLDIDPYLGLVRNIDELLDEVHQLATVYHWTEQDILKLPQPRRKAYLKRIERTPITQGDWL